MGLNSTEIPYQFGQFGSTFLSGDSSKLDLSDNGVDPPVAKYYVCAIQFLSTTVFQELQVLDGGVELGMGNTHFVSTEDTTQVGIIDTDWGAVTDAGDNDAKPIAAGGGGTSFPAGITIYGMWDNVELHSGSCIVYVAPRPDYIKRA
tara:strand:- start:118 stop:558 length:441 start_codon:yes stop_codon:yes gene_type:complete